MSVQFLPVSFGMVNGYLIRGDRCVLVDAGVPGKLKSFLKTLERNDISPQQIELVILTHGHLDHSGLAREIKIRTGAQLAIHQCEAEWLASGESPIPPGTTLQGRILSQLGQWLPAMEIPSVEADVLIGDGGFSLQAYGIPGEVIHTPGHTPGSVSILLDSGEAFVGDLAMSARFMRLTPGFPIFAENLDLVFKSWRKLLDLGAEIIYPAHGKPFRADVFRKFLKES